MAADLRVVRHEFCHNLLWNRVHSPNFGVSHSAGDGIAAILSDPGSQAPDRFQTSPWVPIVADRRHDRGVANGWAWGGVDDVGGYSSEQILSTIHFRINRSMGGDDTDVNVKTAAVHQIVFLIMKGHWLAESQPDHSHTHAGSLGDCVDEWRHQHYQFRRSPGGVPLTS